MPFPIPQGPAGVARIGAGARSLDFLGATYVQVPEADWFNGGAFTFEAWVFARSANQWSRIFDFGNGNPADNVLLAFQDRSGCIDLYIHDAGKNQDRHLVTADALPLNQWVHVAATIDAAGNARVYKNGELWTSGAHLVPRSVSRKLNYIGRSNWAGDQWFNGNISEVRIWSAARSQDEIKSTMLRRLTGAEPNLKGYWRLDETSGTVMTDWTSAGHHGTLSAGPSNMGPGLNFNGANSFLQLPANMPLGAEGTAEMWIYPRSANTWSRFFDFGNGPGADNVIWYFEGDSGKAGFIVYVGPGGGTSITSPEQVPLNQWQHLAVTWSGGKARFYRNGLLWGTEGPVQVPNANAPRQNCFIGRSNWAPDKYLDAAIVEFRMWNRALQVGELNAILTGQESGLVLYLKGNQVNGNTVPDLAPAKRNANGSNVAFAPVPVTVVADPNAQIRFSNDGGASWVAYQPAAYNMRWPWDRPTPGATLAQFRDSAGWETTPRTLPVAPLTTARLVRQVGARALNLDGKSTFVAVGPDYWFTGALTVEAWVYSRNPKANWCRIIDFGNGPNSDNVLFALAGSTGRPCFEVYEAAGSGGKVNAPEALPANQWVHLAATVDAAGNTVLYRNGNFWFAGLTGMPRPVMRRSNFIGRSNWGGDALFDGMLADVRIWNVVRTQQQIQACMSGEFGPDEPGLLGRWLLGEGPGATTALDLSPRSIGGTYTAPGWANVATLDFGRQPFIRQMRFSPRPDAISFWTDWQWSAPAARINLRDGCYQLAVQVKDDIGQDSQPVVEVVYREPPVTSHTQNGDQIALSAVSGLGGPCTIYYRLNGGPETVYSTPIAVAKGQINTLEYWSVDLAGNRDDRHIYTVQA